jgi:hypothetical protein
MILRGRGLRASRNVVSVTMRPWDGGIVACRKCGGARQKVFNGELTLSNTDIESVALAPVYVCNQLLVCLECGFAELTISEGDLDNLRAGPASASRRTT